MLTHFRTKTYAKKNMPMLAGVCTAHTDLSFKEIAEFLDSLSMDYVVTSERGGDYYAFFLDSKYISTVQDLLASTKKDYTSPLRTIKELTSKRKFITKRKAKAVYEKA